MNDETMELFLKELIEGIDSISASLQILLLHYQMQLDTKECEIPFALEEYKRRKQG